MTNKTCDEMALLIQADADGELSPAEAARAAAHVEGCAGCAGLQADLAALSARLRTELPYHAAPEAFRAAMQARFGASAALPGAPAPARAWWAHLPRPRMRMLAPFGGGFALAACVALLLVVNQGVPGRDSLPGSTLSGAVVESHIRALQPGHLMDVVSTDQHTVKPWFDGRLDFAPPVKELKAAGFPLAGGRLDYLDGRPVAALVYRRRQHDINLFVWPEARRLGDHGSESHRSGYNVLRWNQDGMAFWAVSDLQTSELKEFAEAFQTP